MRKLGNRAVVGDSNEDGTHNIDDPNAVNELLDAIVDSAARGRRVIFFCSCGSPHGRETCHRGTVADLLLACAVTRGLPLAVQEWPGGSPAIYDLEVDEQSMTRLVKYVMDPVQIGSRIPVPSSADLARLGAIESLSLLRCHRGLSSLIAITSSLVHTSKGWSLPVHGGCTVPGQLKSMIRDQDKDIRKIPLHAIGAELDLPAPWREEMLTSSMQEEPSDTRGRLANGGRDADLQLPLRNPCGRDDGNPEVLAKSSAPITPDDGVARLANGCTSGGPIPLTRRNVQTATGEELDAMFDVEHHQGALSIVLESRGGTRGEPGARNVDYAAGLEELLRPLRELGAVLADAMVDSRTTQELTPDESRIHLVGSDYPITIGEPAALGRQLGAAQARVGRPAGAKGDGNRTRRIRLFIELEPEPSADELARLLTQTERA